MDRTTGLFITAVALFLIVALWNSRGKHGKTKSRSLTDANAKKRKNQRLSQPRRQNNGYNSRTDPTSTFTHFAATDSSSNCSSSSSSDSVSCGGGDGGGGGGD